MVEHEEKKYATICSINISNPGKSKASGLLLYNKYTNKNRDSEQKFTSDTQT